MVRRSLWMCVGVGCTEPAVDPETQVRQLQLIGAVVEPAEQDPGMSAQVHVVVANPEGLALDWMTWTCTSTASLGGDCSESVDGDPARDWATGTVQDGAWDVEIVPLLDIPDGLVEQLDRTGGQWTGTDLALLACAPGRCRPLNAVDENNLTDDILDDPLTWLPDVPMRRASLGVRATVHSTRSISGQHQNPTMVPLFDSVPEGRPGDTVPLTFKLGGKFGPGLLWPFATLGGFETAEHSAQIGEVVVRWVVPQSAQSGDVGEAWVVVEDRLGGSAIWSGTVRVR